MSTTVGWVKVLAKIPRECHNHETQPARRIKIRNDEQNMTEEQRQHTYETADTRTNKKLQP